MSSIRTSAYLQRIPGSRALTRRARSAAQRLVNESDESSSAIRSRIAARLGGGSRRKSRMADTASASFQLHRAPIEASPDASIDLDPPEEPKLKQASAPPWEAWLPGISAQTPRCNVPATGGPAPGHRNARSFLRGGAFECAPQSPGRQMPTCPDPLSGAGTEKNPHRPQRTLVQRRSHREGSALQGGPTPSKGSRRSRPQRDRQ